MDLTRGEDHPTARLSGPGAGQVWHRVQELAGRARKRLPCGGANRDAGSHSSDSTNAIAWPAPRTPPACQAVTSSHSPVMPQVRCVAAFSKTRPVTAGARVIPSTQVHNLLRASRDRLTKRQQERLRAAFAADEAHISVEVAYLHRASARGLPPSHTHPRPTPGRTPHPAPTTCPIPEIARLGQTLRKWKDALDAYFDTDGASNGSTEAINGHYRAGQTHRQRLPQPHQLQTPNAPHRRRPRRLHPHSTLKSR